MHAVIETPAYLADVKAAGLTEQERADIVVLVANDPQVGDVMIGTGGARKVRIAGRNKGKSGGYRVVTFFAAQDVPVFLLGLINKGERANLSQAERNDLRVILSGLAEDYRAGAAVRSRRSE